MSWVMIIWSIGIAVGPVVGYIYQYKLIRQKKTVGSFSINLCGMLLFCNVMRLAFRIFKQYDVALLVQSNLMIVMQLFLLKLCIDTMRGEGAFEAQKQQQSNQQKGYFANFWRWDVFWKYLAAFAVFSAVVLLLSLILEKVGALVVGELIGFLSLTSESLLMLPQVIQNHKQKRVKGLSHLLVGLNISGDIMKLAYFIIQGQPIQFVVCGILQVIIDALVVIQIIYFKVCHKQNSAEDQIAQNQKGKIDQKMQEMLQKKSDTTNQQKSNSQKDNQGYIQFNQQKNV